MICLLASVYHEAFALSKPRLDNEYNGSRFKRLEKKGPEGTKTRNRRHFKCWDLVNNERPIILRTIGVKFGLRHQLGEGGAQDLARARRFYALGAAQGVAQAQFNLGQMHRSGQGGAPDFGEARRFYALAARQGHAQAQINLAAMPPFLGERREKS